MASRRLCPPYELLRAARLLPAPALLRPGIVLAAAPAGIAGLEVPTLETGLRVPTAAENGAEAVARRVVAGNDVGRRLARDEAALRLVAQHRDELGAIVGLGAQRFVRDDDRGARQCSRRDAIEHILRDGDAVERVLGIVAAVDRHRAPAQAGVITCHRREHMRT